MKPHETFLVNLIKAIPTTEKPVGFSPTISNAAEALKISDDEVRTHVYRLNTHGYAELGPSFNVSTETYFSITEQGVLRGYELIESSETRVSLSGTTINITQSQVNLAGRDVTGSTYSFGNTEALTQLLDTIKGALDSYSIPEGERALVSAILPAIKEESSKPVPSKSVLASLFSTAKDILVKGGAEIAVELIKTYMKAEGLLQE